MPISNTHRWLGACAALGGLLALAMGAYASHAAERLSPVGWNAFLTAWMVHLTHVLAALLVVSGNQTTPPAKKSLCGWALLAGGLVFAMAVYARILWGVSLGIVAPAGGILAMFGWLFMAWIWLQNKNA